MPKDFAPVPLSELKTLTNGEFYDDEFSKGRYSTDASIYQIQPLGVFIPKSKDDVIKAVNFCLNNNISILPRGGGTSQCGQTVNRSLVIDNSKYFNKIIDFDEKNKWKPWQKLYYTISNDYLYGDAFNLVTFPDNHDGARIFSKLNEDIKKFKIAMVFFATTRGIPHFYYGGEILMSNKYPSGIRSDFPGGWPGDEVNGFTGIGLTDMQKDAQSFVKRLLNWRKNKEVIHYGKLMQFAPSLPSYNKNVPHPDDYGVYTYFRYNDEEAVMVMLNNNEETKINLDKFREIIDHYNFSYDPINEVEIDLGQYLTVPANSPFILELTSK